MGSSQCALKQYGLASGDYYLVVARLEPENHILEIVSGFVDSRSRRRLVVVGDYNSDTEYVRSLLVYAEKDCRVKFVGGIYDPSNLVAVRWHVYAYFHGHSVGGTNPSLLEAMVCRNYVIAHDNVFNREVTRDSASYFKSSGEICGLVDGLDVDFDNSVGEKMADIARDSYSWEGIVDAYANRLEVRDQGHQSA